MYNIFDVLSTKAKVITDVMKNVEAVRQLLGHASVAATSACLGIKAGQVTRYCQESHNVLKF